MPSFQALRSSQLAPRAYEALLIQWSLWLGDEVGLAPAQRYPTPNRDRLRFGTLNRRRETPPPHQSSIFSLTRQLFELQLRLVKRTVYLIGKSGKIRYARRGKPAPEEVLAAAE